MAETSGFFNSVNGDRIYGAEDFAQYFRDLVSDGVFWAESSNLEVVSADNGLAVTVLPGSGMIKGYYYKSNEPVTLTLDPANATYDRYDLIVLRYDAVGRSINLGLVKGSAVPEPTPPPLTRTDILWELGLAYVHIPANALTLPLNSIMDTRLDSEKCGLMQGILFAVYGE